MPQRNTRFISNVLYRLKRRYGGKVTFHRDSEVLDTRTGKKIVTKSVWDFKWAILLPSVLVPKFVYDLSYIAANKNFTYGGIFDTSKRRLILDSKDIGNYEPRIDDYFTFDGKRWNVTEIHLFEFDTGYVIVGQFVDGAPVREVHNESTHNRCIFSDSVEVL